ncbi:4-hydroxythreonine-4-phosphate dehydrogenase PdxA [Kiloniella antarctica]|uniref:4-hydroxythreonine-4-phosphate dehydrogenase PdxA n=1 Tax=Kiloniella antarctica TaxID=1550907 RepID=A0ABW5BML2_9PROT
MQTKSKTKPLLVTMGDPSGIGPEIIIKTFVDGNHATPAVVVGDPLVMAQALNQYQPGWAIDELNSLEDISYDSAFNAKSIPVLRSSSLSECPAVGQVSSVSGQAAFDAIVLAIKHAKQGDATGIITAPIHKEALAAAGVKYPGHTEILADYGGVDRVAMMLANDVLRTVLVSVHCSLRESIERADFKAQISAIRFAHEAVLTLGIKKPRVAVAGLNPHAGEGGLFGDEEINIISPAVKAARFEGIDASGPWPGDTVFMQAREGRFDVVVAQYHDQGLIPIKYMGVEQGVNITLGLPFIRTSPDHGTAFDIAGQGIADPSSFKNALKYAAKLVVAQKEETA